MMTQIASRPRRFNRRMDYRIPVATAGYCWAGYADPMDKYVGWETGRIFTAEDCRCGNCRQKGTRLVSRQAGQPA